MALPSDFQVQSLNDGIRTLVTSMGGWEEKLSRLLDLSLLGKDELIRRQEWGSSSANTVEINQSVAGTFSLDISGQGYWIQAGGNINNRIFFDAEVGPTGGSLSVPLANGSCQAVSFKTIRVQIVTGSTSANPLRITIYKMRPWIASIDPLGGGSTVAFTSSQPTYYAIQGATAETVNRPVSIAAQSLTTLAARLANAAGTELYSVAGSVGAPAASNAPILRVSGLPTARLLLESSTPLGAGATLLSTEVPVLCQSDGITSATTINGISMHWVSAGMTSTANQTSTIFFDAGVAGTLLAWISDPVAASGNAERLVRGICGMTSIRMRVVNGGVAEASRSLTGFLSTVSTPDYTGVA